MWSLLFCRRRRPPAAPPSGDHRWDSVPSSPRPRLLNVPSPSLPNVGQPADGLRRDRQVTSAAPARAIAHGLGRVGRGGDRPCRQVDDCTFVNTSGTPDHRGLGPLLHREGQPLGRLASRPLAARPGKTPCQRLPPAPPKARVPRGGPGRVPMGVEQCRDPGSEFCLPTPHLLRGGGGISSTAPTHQLLGSANAETTPAGAPAAAADRKQRPDATCEGKNG